MTTIGTLSPDAAAQALRENGLAAMGLAAPMLSPVWAVTTPTTYDSDALTLDLGANIQAPFGGFLTFPTILQDVHGADGAPLTGGGAVLRMHPQGWQRLRKLVQVRYAAAADAMAVPRTMVMRGATGGNTVQRLTAGESLVLAGPGSGTGTTSFHDARGLAIDPVAVAAMFNDLMDFVAAIATSGSRTGAGGIGPIAGLASGVRVQVLNPHGGPFRAVGDASIAKFTSGTASGAPSATGLIDLPSGDTIGPTGADAAKLRLGWMESGTLGTAALTPATMPSGWGTKRRFLRVVATNLDWHILGNRTAATLNDVPADAGQIPADLQPKVRQSAIEYLTHGPDLLGQVSDIMSGASAGDILVAVSPTIASDLAAPNATGDNAVWPNFPTSSATADFPSPLPDVAANVTAAWTSDVDVVLTIAAGIMPDGATVRAYSRSFKVVPALDSAHPSFVRGDGGAAVVSGAGAVNLLIADPFGLGPGGTKPSSPQLHFDLVVLPRTGKRRAWGDLIVPVTAGPATAPPASFGGADPLTAIPTNRRGIGPSPLFGIPNPTPASGTATSIIDLMRSLASEGAPRAAPRAPLMGRLETIVARGVTSGSATTWRATLSGGRLANETRSVSHGDGNPGNPAGPDLDAAGVRADGRLAYDLARLALKRAMPIVPLPGSTTTEGWLAAMVGNAFNEPADSTGTGFGAALHTVAVAAETPELSLGSLPVPTATTSLSDVVNAIAGALSLPSPPSISAVEPNATRLISEARREYFVSRQGVRDALPALRRAIREAREMIYIESPLFCATGDATADLVGEIKLRLQTHGSLRVVICTPRSPDYALAYGGHIRQAFTDRAAAVSMLGTAAPARVVAFHPTGYPGRERALRSTVVIVDDVWSLVGATHWRRRGFTFDGSVALSSFDLAWRDGHSTAVAAYRRARMASILGLDRLSQDSADAERVRLQEPRDAFATILELIQEGGLGRISPFWTGPPATDTTVIPAGRDLADPDGSQSGSIFSALGAHTSETP